MLAGLAVAGVLLCLCAGRARGHGGPPQAMGVVAVDSRGVPQVVLLNEGLAVRPSDGDEWSFLCPAAWGDTDITGTRTPLADSLGGPRSWVVGADDLYVLRDGMLVAQAHPELSSSAIVALAAGTAALHGLRIDSQGTSVVRIDEPGAPPRHGSPDFWSALSVEPAADLLYLARLEQAPERLLVRTVDGDGRVLDDRAFGLSTPVARLRLQPTPLGLYAVLFDGKGYQLALLEGVDMNLVAHSEGPVAGPMVASDGSTWVAIDGELMLVRADGLAPVGAPEPVTCLGRRGETAYACASTAIHRLGEAGLGEPVFTLDGIGPPAPRLAPAGGERACTQQWQLFRSDLAMIGLRTRDGSVPPAPMMADTPTATDTPMVAGPQPTSPTASASVSMSPAPSSPGSQCGCRVVGRPSGGSALPWCLLGLAPLGWRARARRHATSQA